MTQPATTTISVRGEAQRTVAPDQVQLFTTVSRIADSKAEASAQARHATDELTQRLTDLGGQVLSVHSLRAALTWSVQSVNTHEEYADKGAGGHGPTGRHACDVMLPVTVRDVALLAQVTAALTGRDDIRVQSVNWTVDDDNAEWALVRADAIRAALRKGDDYAAALGGSVIAVDHVADAGLLGGDQSVRPLSARATPFGGRAGMAAGGSDEFSLDPVPQVLAAVIDARFTATIGALPGR